MDKMTPGDVKVEPKVTTEKAYGILESKVDAMLTEVLKGFELSAADVKSRKRIFQAFVTAGGKFFRDSEALSVNQLARRASAGVSFLYPKPAQTPKLTAIDGGIDDEGEEEIEDDGDGDETDSDE